MSEYSPYYEEPGIQIYWGDCAEILPYLPPCEVLLTDPPYGIKRHAGFGIAAPFRGNSKLFNVGKAIER